MKTAYLDTNVIISYIKSSDPSHKSSQRILEGAITLNITSTFTLVELKSVLARSFNLISKNLPGGISNEIYKLSDFNKVQALYLHLLNQIKLRIIENISVEFSNDGYFKGKMFSTYSMASQIANITKLRTMDNIQLAHAILIDRDIEEKIDYFVTGDKEFIKKLKSLKSIKLFTAITPDKLVEIEG